MPDFLTQLLKRHANEPLALASMQAEESLPHEPVGTREPEVSAEVVAAVRYMIDAALFDSTYYLTRYGDIAEAGVDPFDHFFHYGFKEGRSPNPYFDPLWYLDANPEVRDAQLQPLLHYVLFGDKEGRKPSQTFDPAWYRTSNSLGPDENALAHYLKHRATGRFSPNPD